MYVTKKILIKAAFSLIAGVASTVGIRLTNAIWNKCTYDKTHERTEKAEQTLAR